MSRRSALRVLAPLLLTTSIVACSESPRASGEAYAFVPADAQRGALVASIPAQRFDVVASESGLAITRADSRVELRTTRVGRASGLAALAATAPTALGRRVSFTHDALVEWFENGPRGVEHGVDVLARPAGEGVLELEVDVRGSLRPQAVGSSVELVDASGAPQARYADLVVRDDRGAPLNAALAVRDGDIVVRVADDGARYPIHVDPLVTADQAELHASTPAAGDEFGGTAFETSGGPSVAISGDRAVVAAPWRGGGSGGVYVFARSGTMWTQEAQLAPPSDLSSAARFGYSVAIAGDRIAVGAPLAGTGRAFVYVRSGTSWSVEQELAAPAVASGDQFGVAVATDGTNTVVGARYDDHGARPGGSAHVFVRSGSAWSHQARLGASDQATGDEFGGSVAIDGDAIVVGSVFHSAPAFRGAAWVFRRSGTAWAQEGKLVASDTASLDQFARSLSIDGDVVLVGAPQNQVSVFSQGAAYVFTRSGSTWSELTRLVASDAASNDQLGYSVALEGSVLALGARFDDRRASDAGAVYLFERVASGWTQRVERTASDGAAGDRYGDSVALSATTLVVGAPFTDDGAANAGSAYIATIAVTGTPGSSCTLDAECVSGFCVDGVCCDTRCGGGATDCQACSVAAGGATDGTCGPLRAGVAEVRTCRASTADCDAAETCSPSSTSCPADSLAVAGTVCRAASGACDVAETCSGVSSSCPTDGFATTDVECRAAAGVCDVAESCTGSSASCPADGYVAVGVTCRAAVGACDALEACTGSSASCPDDGVALDGTSCANASACDGEEVCSAGACVAGPPIGCDDGDVCTADACDDVGGAASCSHDTILGCCHDDSECDDGDACTADACSSDRCEHTAITGCGDAGVVVDDAGSALDGGTVTSDAGVLVDGGLHVDGGVADSGVRDAGDAAGDLDAGDFDAGDFDAGLGSVAGGCGCRAGASRTDDLGWLVIAALGLVAARRRARTPRS